MPLTDAEKTRYEAAGYTVGTVADLLGLTPEEEQLVELRVAISRAIRARRESGKMTQTSLAKRIQSSQSRIAKAEIADQTVSTDLLLKAFFATGATLRDVLELQCGPANETKGHISSR